MKITINNSLTTFKLLFSDFLTSCKAKGLSEKTLQSYSSHLKCFGKYLDLDTPIEDLTQKHIEQMVTIEIGARWMLLMLFDAFQRMIL